MMRPLHAGQLRNMQRLSPERQPNPGGFFGKVVMPKMGVNQRLYPRAGPRSEPEARRRLIVQLTHYGAESGLKKGFFARKIMNDQSCRDTCMVRDFVERKFNYSIFSQNTDSRGDNMLATINSNLLHKREYQTLNAYSIMPIQRRHSPLL
ncbi:hypothetical protein GGR91_001786 [Sphingorhabdus rigui]|uniref:Uncharacterized protein n=1 Tax=Sphingorhabdus rigui TaxID=1282858 RepID=A0A840AZK1_9SPHN|nr:hypothetical protein [Sphingorhabdus rigui]